MRGRMLDRREADTGEIREGREKSCLAGEPAGSFGLNRGEAELCNRIYYQRFLQT